MKRYLRLLATVVSSLVVIGLVSASSTAFAESGETDGGDEIGEPRQVVDLEDRQVVDLEEMTRDGVELNESQSDENTDDRDAEPAMPSMMPFDDPRPHWMFVVGRNAVWGGMIGGLVGVGAYLVTGMEPSPWIISRFAGGGILIGAASGLIEAFLWSNGFLAGTPASVDWFARTHGVPGTHDVRLLNVKF